MPLEEKLAFIKDYREKWQYYSVRSGLACKPHPDMENEEEWEAQLAEGKV
jgi:hypothetical protein